MGALACRPTEAAALLGERMRPVVAAGSDRVARLVADLDSEEYAVREAAEGELRGQGRLVAAALRKALATDPSPEAYRRLQRLLRELQGNAPRLPLRTLRCLEVLEHLGGVEAERILRDLAGGASEVGLTGAAKAVLRRLARPPSAFPARPALR